MIPESSSPRVRPARTVVVLAAVLAALLTLPGWAPTAAVAAEDGGITLQSTPLSTGLASWKTTWTVVATNANPDGGDAISEFAVAGVVPQTASGTPIQAPVLQSAADGCTLAGSTVSCALRTALEPGESTTLTFAGTVPPSTGDTFTMTATVVGTDASTTASSPIAQPWACVPNGYLFQSNDVLTGAASTLKIATGKTVDMGAYKNNINALGYNVLDGYLYGWSEKDKSLVRVDQNLNITDLPTPAELVSGTFHMGDVDPNGYLWMSSTGYNSPIYKIDVIPGSPTFGTIVKKLSRTDGNLSLGGDWSYYKTGTTELLIGVSNVGNQPMFTWINLATGGIGTKGIASTSFGIPTNTYTFFGATFTDGKYLYAAENISGKVVRINPAIRSNPIGPADVILASTAKPTTNNDGAMCPTARMPSLTVSTTASSRANPADQFQIAVQDSTGATVSSAATTGSTLTAQTTSVLVQGSTYTIVDSLAAGSRGRTEWYAPKIACTDPLGESIVPTPTGAGTWTLNIAAATDYSCAVTNTPGSTYTVSKTASATSVLPDGTTMLSYTVAVTGTGTQGFTADAPASFADDLSAVLGNASYNGDATASSGTVSYSGGVLSWSGALSATGTATVTYSVTVGTTGGGALTNALTPTADGGSCDGVCTVTTTVAAYLVSVSAPTSVNAGGRIGYTLTVTNTGGVDYPAGTPATLTDDLSSVLSRADYNDDASASSGTVTVSGTHLTWAGPLAAGATATITYSVTPTAVTGDLVNTVAASAAGGSCDPAASCTATTAITSSAPVFTADAPQALTGTVGTAYASYTFAASGVPAPTFSVTPGSLPTGMTLDEKTGVLSGTPSAAGSFRFTVVATNAAGTATGAPHTIVIAPQAVAPVFTADAPQALTGTVGTAYASYTFAASGVPAPTFSVSPGSLPTGMTLDEKTGVLSGTPSAAGSFRFTVVATNAAGTATGAPHTIVIDRRVDRVSGDDRFATAVGVSKAGFPDGAPIVFLASGAVFPDALSAGPAAAKLGGPVLLSMPDALPGAVADEITRLDPAKVIVVGGPAAVSDAVLAQVKALVPATERWAGSDRFETSREIADRAFGSGATRAFVATGSNFPDALSAGAAIGASGPVILINGGADRLDAATSGALSGLHASDLMIAGGPNAVSAGIQSQMDGIARTTRLGGDDRFDTAERINAQLFQSADRVLLATGFNFPDALSGSAWAPTIHAPLFVVQGSCVPAGVLTALNDLGVGTVTLLGGPVVLDQDVTALRSCG